jgi:hypothetical protein
VQKVEEFKLSIPKAKLLAACYPFAMEIPEDVTAYVVTGAGKWTYDTKQYDYAYIEEVQGGVVPAYMPVIYVGTAQAEYNVAVLAGDNTPHVDGNLLHGTTIRAYLTKGSFLGTVASTIAGGAIMTLKTSTSSGIYANKSYLLKSDVGNVTTVYLADKDVVTSIEGVEAEDGEVVLYDLNGVKVVTPERNGIYVTSSGKKVLVK